MRSPVPVADDEDASAVHSGGMSARPELYTEALERAWKHARDWLADVPGRRVPPRDDRRRPGRRPRRTATRPADATPATVVDLLAAASSPG